MPNNRLIVTVSQLNRKVSFMFKGEKTFENISVRGEISNLSINAKSGHMYFTLRDDAAAIRAVMFSSYVENLKFMPENGISVIVSGSVQCYERDGIYQIKAYDMVQDGAGAIANAFEVLKEKLLKEGLFSRKRELPVMPKKICVVTSETGAVIHDIRNVLERRCPFVELILIPAAVQGDSAPASIVSAIKRANDETDCDVLIFGRGGGSSEDLSAFNDESVVRAVFASRIPTISAVGHETDFSLADFAADRRVPTPSAAAEIAVPDMRVIISELEEKKSRIYDKALRIADLKLSLLRLKQAEIQLKSPVQRIESNEQKLNALKDKLDFRINGIIEQKMNSVMRTAAVIEALNPLNVLMRGYSITYKNDFALTDSDNVDIGDKLTVKLNKGFIDVVVENKGKVN